MGGWVGDLLRGGGCFLSKGFEKKGGERKRDGEQKRRENREDDFTKLLHLALGRILWEEEGGEKGREIKKKKIK